jgi:hypothetical chaperone protein
MTDKPSVFAIDFGTSNSLLAAASRERVFDPAPLDPAAGDPTVLRSALYFTDLKNGVFGVEAPRQLVENGFRGRLIRSIKRHLPSRSFTNTRIGDKLVSLEDLIAAFLRAMRERAAAHYEADVQRVVLGRPARFSNDPELDALAEQRLRKAAVIAGFREIEFCPEPVAAAYDFAADLDEPQNVLVADLGGGTSDYTLVRMHRGGFQPSDVLAVGGVAVAGDAIDGALVRARLGPEFGSTTRYRVPFGNNVLDMPIDLLDILSSPADLTLVDRKTVLRRIADIRAGALDKDDAEPRLERLYAVIEDGVGFTLYESVETTKRRLSDAESAPFIFDYPGAELELEVTRAELEQAASRAVERITAALDETLLAGGVGAEQVDILCVTGGTSRMPLALRELERRLPRARLRRLKSFHSVVQGLARRARELA